MQDRPTRFGAQLWSQGTDWPGFRDAALAAEAGGWDSVWTWDHLNAIFGPWEQPILEGWSLLSAVAPLTGRVRPIVIRDRRSAAEATFARLLEHNGAPDAGKVPVLLGSPAEIAAGIAPYRDLGFRTVIARLPAYDRETIDRIGEVGDALGG